MSEIEKAVREELGKIVKIDTMAISADANLTQEAELDSLSVLELFGMIEDRFHVLVPPEKVSEMNTINDIVKIIEECK